MNKYEFNDSTRESLKYFIGKYPADQHFDVSKYFLKETFTSIDDISDSIRIIDHIYSEISTYDDALYHFVPVVLLVVHQLLHINLYYYAGVFLTKLDNIFSHRRLCIKELFLMDCLVTFISKLLHFRLSILNENPKPCVKDWIEEGIQVSASFQLVVSVVPYEFITPSTPIFIILSFFVSLWLQSFIVFAEGADNAINSISSLFLHKALGESVKTHPSDLFSFFINYSSNCSKLCSRYFRLMVSHGVKPLEKLLRLREDYVISNLNPLIEKFCTSEGMLNSISFNDFLSFQNPDEVEFLVSLSVPISTSRDGYSPLSISEDILFSLGTICLITSYFISCDGSMLNRRELESLVNILILASTFLFENGTRSSVMLALEFLSFAWFFISKDFSLHLLKEQVADLYYLFFYFDSTVASFPNSQPLFPHVRQVPNKHDCSNFLKEVISDATSEISEGVNRIIYLWERNSEKFLIDEITLEFLFGFSISLFRLPTLSNFTVEISSKLKKIAVSLIENLIDIVYYNNIESDTSINRFLHQSSLVPILLSHILTVAIRYQISNGYLPYCRRFLFFQFILFRRSPCINSARELLRVLYIYTALCPNKFQTGFSEIVISTRTTPEIHTKNVSLPVVLKQLCKFAPWLLKEKLVTFVPRTLCVGCKWLPVANSERTILSHNQLHSFFSRVEANPLLWDMVVHIIIEGNALVLRRHMVDAKCEEISQFQDLIGFCEVKLPPETGSVIALLECLQAIKEMTRINRESLKHWENLENKGVLVSKEKWLSERYNIEHMIQNIVTKLETKVLSHWIFLFIGFEHFSNSENLELFFLTDILIHKISAIYQGYPNGEFESSLTGCLLALVSSIRELLFYNNSRILSDLTMHATQDIASLVIDFVYISLSGICEAFYSHWSNILSKSFHAELQELAAFSVAYLLNFEKDITRKYAIEVRNFQSQQHNVRSHVYLVLDSAIHYFPWEGLSFLSRQTISRIPSCSWLASHAHTSYNINTDSDIGCIFHSCPTLAKSHQRLVKSPAWNSSWIEYDSSCFSLSDLNMNLIHKIQKLKVLLYIGHGKGEKYISRDDLHRASRWCNSFPGVILMGCGSAFMEFIPTSQLFGLPYAYLQVGSPSFVGCLWDVTDKDLDNLTTLFLSGFLNRVPSKRKTNAEAIQEARNNCRFPYLTGFGTVIYGINYKFS